MGSFAVRKAGLNLCFLFHDLRTATLARQGGRVEPAAYKLRLSVIHSRGEQCSASNQKIDPIELWEYLIWYGFLPNQ
jgi:hypothetical protein